MYHNRSAVERERHTRALWYVVVAFGLAGFAYLFLGFDQTQTMGYAVSCFVMLHVVNFRAMFSPLPADPPEERRQTND